MIISGLITLHGFAAILWVGGLVFMYLVLRPSLQELAPESRVALMAGIFRRFFQLVWGSIAVLYVTGSGLIHSLYGTMAATPLPVHFMIGVAHVMTGVFVYVWFRPYARFRRLVADGDVADALTAAYPVRRWATVNLALGLVASLLGAISPYAG